MKILNESEMRGMGSLIKGVGGILHLPREDKSVPYTPTPPANYQSI